MYIYIYILYILLQIRQQIKSWDKVKEKIGNRKIIS